MKNTIGAASAAPAKRTLHDLIGTLTAVARTLPAGTRTLHNPDRTLYDHDETLSPGDGTLSEPAATVPFQANCVLTPADSVPSAAFVASERPLTVRILDSAFPCVRLGVPLRPDAVQSPLIRVRTKG